MQLRHPDPILVIDLFPEVLDGLLAVLEQLSPQQWASSTACAGWSVKDVALHLLGVEIGNLSSRRDGFSVPGEVHTWTELVTFLNDFNEVWVRAARRISTPLLIDFLRHTGEQMCSHFRTLDPHAMGRAVSWVGPEPAPVWLDIAREYTERWCHQQHIRSAVGISGLGEPRYLTPVLATFSHAMPRALRSAFAPEGAVVTLTVGGNGGGQWSARQEDGRWRLYTGSVEDPTAEVRVEADIAWQLFTRGVTQERALQEVTILGDQRLGEPVLDMVAIIA